MSSSPKKTAKRDTKASIPPKKRSNAPIPWNARPYTSNEIQSLADRKTRLDDMGLLGILPNDVLCEIAGYLFRDCFPFMFTIFYPHCNFAENKTISSRTDFPWIREDDPYPMMISCAVQIARWCTPETQSCYLNNILRSFSRFTFNEKTKKSRRHENYLNAILGNRSLASFPKEVHGRHGLRFIYRDPKKISPPDKEVDECISLAICTGRLDYLTAKNVCGFHYQQAIYIGKEDIIAEVLRVHQSHGDGKTNFGFMDFIQVAITNGRLGDVRKLCAMSDSIDQFVRILSFCVAMDKPEAADCIMKLAQFKELGVETSRLIGAFSTNKWNRVCDLIVDSTNHSPFKMLMRACSVQYQLPVVVERYLDIVTLSELDEFVNSPDVYVFNDDKITSLVIEHKRLDNTLNLNALLIGLCTHRQWTKPRYDRLVGLGAKYPFEQLYKWYVAPNVLCEILASHNFSDEEIEKLFWKYIHAKQNYKAAVVLDYRQFQPHDLLEHMIMFIPEQTRHIVRRLISRSTSVQDVVAMECTERDL